jgi:PAS domain S-box-containing protein
LIFKTFADRIAHLLLKDGKKNWPAIAVMFFLALLPALLLAAFSYLKTSHDLTDLAFSQRQDIAYLAATTLKEKLDRLADLSISLASRVRFRQLVSEGKWDEAVQILSTVPKDFPFIDRLFLSDLDGTLRADTPALPDVRGKNFASRDWYQGISKAWKPYVSEVYQRAAEPRYNVIAAAAPIKGPDENTTAILVLQVKLDSLLQWTNNVEVGPHGFVFVVDKRGKIAAHPKFAPQEKIVDYSKAVGVHKALRGVQGVEILFDAIESEQQVVAYQPVAGYGWGVVVQQPTRTAFAVRDSSLRRISVGYGFILLLNCGLAYLTLNTLIRVKQAEEGSSKLASIAEYSNDAIIGKTLKGVITSWNKGAERIYGYSPAEVIGKPITLLIPSNWLNEMPDILERVKRGEPIEHYETVRLKKDGTRIDVSLTISPVKHSTGTIIGASTIARDITERKRADEEVRKINAQLEAANKELEAFSYSVSHDLRAPLRAVDGFSRILLEEHHHELSDGGRRFLGLVCENSQKMGLLIDDLLSFSRLSRQPVKKRNVAMADLARQIFEELKPEQNGRRVELSVADLPQCQGDPTLLEQVFVNLLSNAVKYSRNREVGRIEVGCERMDGENVYFVKDNGAGFDMRYADKLFGVFQRLHRAEEYEGTGVGLAIVQRIVNRHGGRVWAQAEINKGATFYFTLEGGNSSAAKSS